MILRLRRCLGHTTVTAAMAATAGAAACSGTDKTPTAPVPVTVIVNGSAVSVTIAATRAARDQGLMGVQSLGANNGMLFVFADDRQRAFWMKDTPTALSIAFLDASKKVVFLADMAPNALTLHGGLNAPQMRYALEVNQGWFSAHGLTAGMTVAFTLPAGLVVEPDP